MIWLNIQIPTLRSPEFIGSDPISRATWLYVLAYACEQENGGEIANCKGWKDRQWQQTCGVTLDEINASFPLLSWSGDSLIVAHYPADKEAEVKAKRDGGSRGGKMRAANDLRRKSEHDKPQASSIASSTPSSSASTERKGMERKGIGMEEEKILKENSSLSLLDIDFEKNEAAEKLKEIKRKRDELNAQAHAIYKAYPLKVGKPKAIQAIQRQLVVTPFAELLRLTQDFATARGADLSFVPHPSTWFNQQRFNDDPATWERNQDGKRAEVATHSKKSQFGF